VLEVTLVDVDLLVVVRLEDVCLLVELVARLDVLDEGILLDEVAARVGVLDVRLLVKLVSRLDVLVVLRLVVDKCEVTDVAGERLES